MVLPITWTFLHKINLVIGLAFPMKILFRWRLQYTMHNTLKQIIFIFPFLKCLYRLDKYSNMLFIVDIYYQFSTNWHHINLRRIKNYSNKLRTRILHFCVGSGLKMFLSLYFYMTTTSMGCDVTLSVFTNIKNNWFNATLIHKIESSVFYQYNTFYHK